MSQIEKSKSYRGETVLDRDIWNQRVSAYIGEYSVELNSARWSGRQSKEDAVTGIGELIEFLCEVRREILNVSEPRFKAGTFTKMSPVVLSAKGAEFNRLDRERHTLEMLQEDAEKSWRAEIVEEEVKRDEPQLVDVSALCKCASRCGTFFDERGNGYFLYMCETHEREYLVKRGERHGA